MSVIDVQSRKLNVYAHVSQGENRMAWSLFDVITTKSFTNTIVSKEVQKEFVDDLGQFLSSVQLYTQRGQPFRRGYVLHGPPGTGKSSLIKAAAKEYGLDIYTCNLANITALQFQSLINEMNFRSSAHKPHILAFEDVDRTSLYNIRNKLQFIQNIVDLIFR